MRRISEPSSYRLDDLSLKTDGWYLYECCFPAPWNRPVTITDVRSLNSGVPPGSNPALWNRPVTITDVHCLNSGVPPGTPENPSIFKPVSRATKAMKIGPKATQHHEKLTLESQEIQFLRKLIFAIPSMPNACFCNPGHPNSDPKIIRKSNLEIDMTKSFFFCQKETKKLSKSVPQINKKSIESKPGPHRVLPCALQCPRIVPGSSQDRPRIVPGYPRTPK